MNLIVLAVLLIAKMEHVLTWVITLYKMGVKYLESTSYTPEQACHFVVNRYIVTAFNRNVVDNEILGTCCTIGNK